MFKKIVLIPCLIYTISFSKEITSYDIDPSLRGVALGTFLSYQRAKRVVKKLPDFDIYIKQTTTTRKTIFRAFCPEYRKREPEKQIEKDKVHDPFCIYHIKIKG